MKRLLLWVCNRLAYRNQTLPDSSVLKSVPSRDRDSWPRWKLLLLCGFWVGMFIGTHLPKIPQAVRHVSDKSMHGAAFAGLALLLTWTTYGRFRTFGHHLGFVLGIIGLYGALDELLQIPVGRSCEFGDWVADVLGASLGFTLFYTGQWLWQQLPSGNS